MNTASRIRYNIEQILLPEMFYSNGALMLFKMMGAQGDSIMTLYHQAEQKNSLYKCPYTEKEFLESHMVYHTDDTSLLLLRIQMPEPEEPLLCRAIYLCFDQESSDTMLFLSEQSLSGDYCLCARPEDGMHVNFGSAPERYTDEFDYTADLFHSRAKISPLQVGAF